jgi:hypothetical protein
MEDFRHFSHDDDERAVDETPLALHLLAAPQDLDPELSPCGVVLCCMGDLLAGGMLMATLKTLWAWLAWSNLLLLLLQLLLTVGVWIVLLAFCTTRLIADHQHKQKNQSLRQQRQSLQQAWFDELLQAKRDARQRKNKALETELHLRETRLPANTEGNRDAIYDPHTGQIVVAPSGNFAQPVPNTFHYHVAVPGVKGSADKPEQLLAPLFPPPRDFADILQWFRPSMHEVYLAETIREPLTSKVYDLCHVGVGGPTGGGKTNATRLIIAQLLSHDVQAFLAALRAAKTA